jgi:NADPH2:quinone reductase
MPKYHFSWGNNKSIICPLQLVNVILIMKAIVVEHFGGPDQLVLLDAADPDGEIVVKAAWAGVNFVDMYQREGHYPGVVAPLFPGIEGSGVIIIAPKDSTWHAGDRVAFATGVQGSYAERVNVPAAHLVSVPDDISLRDACATLDHGLTAIVLTEKVAHLNPKSTVLVHAAAGGVGGWLVQLLVAKGHRVLGTVSSADKAAWLSSVGANPIRYDGDAEWSANVMHLTNGCGVDVVFDSVGKATFTRSLEVVALKGHVILFGAASGQPDPVDILCLMHKSITLTRPVMPHYLNTPELLRSCAARVFQHLRDGSIKPRIHGQYALADAAHAHLALEERRTQGKLLLAIAPDLI